MATKKPKLRKGLIKKGAPHPTSPDFKLVSSHLTDKQADKAEDKLMENPRVVDTKRIFIPRQHAVYAKRIVRITPKRPRLRR